MKHKMLHRRALSLLLTGLMLLSMIPTALAAVTCPACGSGNCTKDVHLEANCHEKGVDRYICRSYGKTSLQETAINKNNHDAECEDNGDGKTHTAECPYDNYYNEEEEHTFADGRCTKCFAVDYSDVEISVPSKLEIYVGLDAEDAKLSLGDVALYVGKTDISDDYDLTYNWYRGGKLVGSGETYTLPADDTAEEDDLEFVCFVMAMPKTDVNARSLNASCTVTVYVRELVTAYAAVSTEDLYFDLDDTNNRTSVSIIDQIYNAVYDASAGYPDYVVFDKHPSTKVGSLDCVEGREYSFDEDASRYLGDLRFVPSEDTTGSYTINFTAYDTKNKSYFGTLTITVERTLGDMDIYYTATKGDIVDFDAEDFSNFWLDTYGNGYLISVSFPELPAASSGVLYFGYTSSSRPGTKVRTDDTFYYEPGKNEDEIDLTFVPAGKFTGYVTLPFEAYGKNNKNSSSYMDGTMYIFVSDGSVEDVSYRVTGSSVTLNAADFLDVYRDAADEKATALSIQFLQLPENGSLYVDYTGSAKDTELTEKNVSDYLFHYSSERDAEIGDVTFVPGSAARDTATYIAYDSKGELQYIGTVSFAKGDLTVTYRSTSAGVSFKSADFEKVLGLSSPKVALSFTLPANGTLYYNYTGAAGVKVSSKDTYYLSTGTPGVSSLTYVPKAGQSGVVSIPFTATDLNGNKLSGTVKITVTSTTAVKTFTDVKSTDWFYTYVTDLATAGIINGMTDTTFEPNGEVTYGQALKMIMLATGYNIQQGTGGNWAKPFYDKALQDGLLSKTVSDLNRKIDRHTIAEIAAKAMKLPATTLKTSPFSDSNNQYAMALYEAGIITGSILSDGRVMYYGVNSIRRSEIAAIIWRINNYYATNG